MLYTAAPLAGDAEEKFTTVLVDETETRLSGDDDDLTSDTDAHQAELPAEYKFITGCRAPSCPAAGPRARWDASEVSSQIGSKVGSKGKGRHGRVGARRPLAVVGNTL